MWESLNNWGNARNWKRNEEKNAWKYQQKEQMQFEVTLHILPF